MSRSDEYRQSKHTDHVLVRADWLPSAVVVPVPVRNYVNRERQDKRVAVEARTLHNREIADLDMREQVREALFSAEYTGPVGTKMAEWERVLLGKDEPMDWSSTQEVRLTDCMYGCKVYRDANGKESILHSETYGHEASWIEQVFVPEPAPVKVQHVIPKRERMSNNKRERDERSLEREMRDLGFGGRYGIHL